VHSNDPVRPRLTLTLRVEVLGSVSVLPQEVLFMRSRPGEPMVARGLIRQDPTEKGGILEVSDVEVSEDWLVASVERLFEAQPRGGGLPAGRAGDWRLEVHFRDDEPVFGRRRANVSFRTGLPRQPSVELPVIVNLQAPVNFSKPQLTMRPTSGGMTGDPMVVSVRRGLDPSQLRVEARPSSLEVEIEPSGERMFKVGVGWKGEDRPEALLIFHVGDERIRLPIVWVGGTP